MIFSVLSGPHFWRNGTADVGERRPVVENYRVSMAPNPQLSPKRSEIDHDGLGSHFFIEFTQNGDTNGLIADFARGCARVWENRNV